MLSISTYYSLSFLVLLLITVVLYSLVPQKFKRWVLLIFSYIFFYAISGKLLLYLLFSTLSVHHLGLWLNDSQKECSEKTKGLEKEEKKKINALYTKKQRGIMAFAIILHVGLLFVLKYSPFVTTNINLLFSLCGTSFNLNVPSFLIPIGISFYTLQAVSYLFDVYRKIIPADKNLGRLALYMSFFPQLMEGPICRYSDTAEALWDSKPIKFENFISGSQRIIFGFMKKLIVADRLNLFIDEVFTGYENYDGLVIALAAVFYTFQLYCDFSGTIDVALGSAEIFGIKLPENFRRPFFSTTISEFWKRWHITLGTWFKDYIFYPMSMSKPLKKLTKKAREKLGNHFGPLIAGSIALFCVWFSNGVWHGAGWNYIFFGMYHFVLILIGNIIEPYVIKGTTKLKIKRSSLPYRIFQIIRTCILVCIGELFFRAEGLKAGLTMFGRIVTNFTLTTVKDRSIFTMGVDFKDYIVLIFTALLIFVISLLQEKGVHIRQSIGKRNIIIQFIIYYALILFIIIFGGYGLGYIPVDPIYANF